MSAVESSKDLTKDQIALEGIGNDYKYGFSDKEDYIFKSGRGLTEEIVRKISEMKKEPEWMLDFRLKALNIFRKKPMPTWGNCHLLNEIDFDSIFYYIKPSMGNEKNWEDVPDKIKNTFDRLGIPEAERKFLAGVSAQYESEVVYHSIREDLTAQGVIFLDMDSGLREHEDIVRKHFATVIPTADNKFSALNSAVWSGGSFIWVPEGVHVEIPLQAYFRINAENMGQFERTLIIAEPGSSVHYIEGCTAPTYSSDSLHSAVVELIAKKGAHIRYTTIQNWSKNVFNLVTKRAVAHEDAKVEWVDGNLGSKLTMKYPAIFLMGPRAHGEVLSIAFAGEDQHQDAGAKILHAAPDTTSQIISKSISKNGGRTSYRGLIKVTPGATNVKSSVKCDALLLDEASRSDTYPTMEIDEKEVNIEHEATVSKVGEEQLFYLMSRGLTQDEATAMIVNGFFEPFTKELPLEYAVELNRLIQLEMEGSVG
ncbi:MAG: Fe-S cluster assembly protein SufB [Cyanobacteriota bacterium erpe_2018_sw_39hr_WHONDRS-SW48-000098_B_bin.30]|nr:Fe-S cluster assembly protein SufB [Cyanobacteriota bacterium erpe_2018_sw_39hr_WHONDRS-SW48-000098_B_bin.30]